MRRTLVLLATLVMLVFGLAVAEAAPSPEGTLNATFRSDHSGGRGVSYATDAHDGMGALHAANIPGRGILQPGAVRLIPGGEDQTFCSSNVFGIWWHIPGPNKEDLRDVEVHIWFDGTELPLTKTAVKRWVDPQDFFGEEDWEWWFSEGVPVLGTLAVGEYETASTVVNWPEPGDVEEIPPVLVTIEDC